MEIEVTFRMPGTDNKCEGTAIWGLYLFAFPAWDIIIM